MKKIVTTVLALGLAAVALTGCAAETATNPAEPAQLGKSEAGDNTQYQIEYVELEDGSVIKCLWYGKDYSHGASMSCDWENITKK